MQRCIRSVIARGHIRRVKLRGSRTESGKPSIVRGVQLVSHAGASKELKAGSGRGKGRRGGEKGAGKGKGRAKREDEEEEGSEDEAEEPQGDGEQEMPGRGADASEVESDLDEIEDDLLGMLDDGEDGEGLGMGIDSEDEPEALKVVEMEEDRPRGVDGDPTNGGDSKSAQVDEEMMGEDEELVDGGERLFPTLGESSTSLSDFQLAVEADLCITSHHITDSSSLSKFPLFQPTTPSVQSTTPIDYQILAIVREAGATGVSFTVRTFASPPHLIDRRLIS
jgi:hypothetical protein